MSAFWSLLKYLCFLFCVLYADSIGILPRYRMKLISLEKCRVPDDKMDKSVDLTFYMSARKVTRETSLIRFNFTVGHRAGPLLVTFRCYQIQQNNIKDLVFQSEKINCDNAMIYPFVKALNLKIDKSCNVYKGFYKRDDLDINDYASILASVIIEPGKYAYDLEFVTKKGVVACISLSSEVNAIK